MHLKAEFKDSMYFSAISQTAAGLTLHFVSQMEVVHKLGIVFKWWAHFESIERCIRTTGFSFDILKGRVCRVGNSMLAIVPLWCSDCLSTGWACTRSLLPVFRVSLETTASSSSSVHQYTSCIRKVRVKQLSPGNSNTYVTGTQPTE